MSIQQQIINAIAETIGCNFKILNISPDENIIGKYFVNVNIINNYHIFNKTLIVQIPITESTIYIKNSKIIQSPTEQLQFPQRKQIIDYVEINGDILTIHGTNLTGSILCTYPREDCIKNNCICSYGYTSSNDIIINKDSNMYVDNVSFNIGGSMKDYPVENYTYKDSNGNEILLGPYINTSNGGS